MTTAALNNRALGRRTILASAIAIAALACATGAHAQGDLVILTVVDRETGQVLPVWRRDGRLFVAGEQGERYSLRVTNHTDGRVLVVLSVDGVNIYTGQTAKYDQGGYILSPYESYDINGWRKSTTEVAAFSFTALPQSYAARTGRPGDVGVIGMAVFRERPASAVSPLAASPQRAPEASVTARRAAPPPDMAPPPPLPIPPVEKPIQAPPAPAPAPPPPAASLAAPNRFADETAPAPRDAKLGTAHGDRERSVINIVSFLRATSYPQLVRQIEYDSYANLVAAGVIPSPSRPGRPPRAFPQNGAAPGFVPDPPAR